MSKKDIQEKEPEGGTADRVYRRMIASAAFYSGAIARYRQAAIDEGAPPWRIIRYQRITDPEKVPYPIPLSNYVRPETFEKQLRYLAKECRVVTFEKLLEEITAGAQIADNTVVITFDGGYLEQFAIAAPLLQRYRLPATFFPPTAYIGTRNYFWQDKITVGMTIFKNLELTIPALSFLDDEFYSAMKVHAPNGEITPRSIALLINALSRATPTERLSAIYLIGEMLNNVADLPQELCFMDWNHLRELQRRGHHVGSIGHGYGLLKELTPEELTADLIVCAESFGRERIPTLPIYAFPEGLFTEPAIALLHSHGFKHQVAIGPVPKYTPEPDKPLILGRVAMYQDVAFCPEVFACRLWELKLSGIAF